MKRSLKKIRRSTANRKRRQRKSKKKKNKSIKQRSFGAFYTRKKRKSKIHSRASSRKKTFSYMNLIQKVALSPKDPSSYFHHLSKALQHTKLGTVYLRKDFVLNIAYLFCTITRAGLGVGKLGLGAVKVYAKHGIRKKEYSEMINSALKNLSKLVSLSDAKFKYRSRIPCTKMKGIPSNRNYFSLNDDTILTYPLKRDKLGNPLVSVKERGEWYLKYPVRLHDLLVLLDYLIFKKLLHLEDLLSNIGIINVNSFKKIHKDDVERIYKKCRERRLRNIKHYETFKTYYDLFAKLTISYSDNRSDLFCLSQALSYTPFGDVYLRKDVLIGIAKLVCDIGISGWGLGGAVVAGVKGIARLAENVKYYTGYEWSEYTSIVGKAITNIDKVLQESDISFSEDCKKLKHIPNNKYYIKRKLNKDDKEGVFFIPVRWATDGDVVKTERENGEWFCKISLSLQSILIVLNFAISTGKVDLPYILEKIGIIDANSSYKNKSRRSKK